MMGECRQGACREHTVGTDNCYTLHDTDDLLATTDKCRITNTTFNCALIKLSIEVFVMCKTLRRCGFRTRYRSCELITLNCFRTSEEWEYCFSVSPPSCELSTFQKQCVDGNKYSSIKKLSFLPIYR